MKDLKDKLDEFERTLDFFSPSIPFTFVQACKNLGVDIKEFDEYIFSQVGMSGEEVIDLYRRIPSNQNNNPFHS